jgi:hypothetical protein
MKFSGPSLGIKEFYQKSKKVVREEQKCGLVKTKR